MTVTERANGRVVYLNCV